MYMYMYLIHSIYGQLEEILAGGQALSTNGCALGTSSVFVIIMALSKELRYSCSRSKTGHVVILQCSELHAQLCEHMACIVWLAFALSMLHAGILIDTQNGNFKTPITQDIWHFREDKRNPVLNI